MENEFILGERTLTPRTTTVGTITNRVLPVFWSARDGDGQSARGDPEKRNRKVFPFISLPHECERSFSFHFLHSILQLFFLKA